MKQASLTFWNFLPKSRNTPIPFKDQISGGEITIKVNHHPPTANTPEYVEFITEFPVFLSGVATRFGMAKGDADTLSQALGTTTNDQAPPGTKRKRSAKVSAKRKGSASAKP